MKRIAFALVFVSLSLASCMTYRLTPQESADATIRLDRGKAILTQLKDRIGVAVSSEVNGNLVYFHVIVKNFREDNLYVDDSEATITENADLDMSTTTDKVYRADEFYQQRRSQILTGQVLMAVSAAMAAQNAGRSYSYTTGNYSIYGSGRTSYYQGYGTYSSNTYTYDSAKAAMERQIAFANVREYVNGTNRELEFLKDTLFYPSDISAGDEYYGIIVSELGKEQSSSMQLSLGFGGVQFNFIFKKDQLEYGSN